MEETTKDYSKVYHEESAPIPTTRRSTNKTLDGVYVHRRHQELGMGIDPNALSSALYNLSAAQHRAYAIDTLQQHYSSVFKKKSNPSYKVYINYSENSIKKETYLVRVEKNTLRQVKQKLPIKGDFRFFIHNGNICEEVEEDEAILPYVEKDGAPIIYCRVFSK